MSHVSQPFAFALSSILVLSLGLSIAVVAPTNVRAQEKSEHQEKHEHDGDSKKHSEKKQDGQKTEKEHGGKEHAEEKATTPSIISVSDNNIYFAASPDWKAVTPKSRIVEKEFSIPAVDKDTAGGRLTIMGAGGPIDQNIARWYQQFSQPDGKSTKDVTTIKQETIAGQEVHLVDITGTFSGGMGPMAPKKQLKDYRMLAAIVKTKKHGQYFVKLTGPAATIKANEDQFAYMINSLSIGAPPKVKPMVKPRSITSRDGGLKFSVPGDWESVQLKATTMLDSEFSLPASKGDKAGGRLTFMRAGGDLEANVVRWYGQFKRADGGETSDVAKQTKEEIADRTVHMVDISGTFAESMGGGPFGKKTDRENYRMLAAIIELDEGDGAKYFLKLTGPAKTIEDNAKAFQKMVQSLKVIE